MLALFAQVCCEPELGVVREEAAAFWKPMAQPQARQSLKAQRRSPKGRAHTCLLWHLPYPRPSSGRNCLPLTEAGLEREVGTEWTHSKHLP